MNLSPQDIKLIAFYLPQFHPIPENDEWWGKGFTEWTNVATAKPLFAGHYQPHIPADLGFYDLRLSEARVAQADLARAYGIHGFCYYHYWFNGRRIIERPFEEVLESGVPDFPFCLCWANENWTRTWDGGSDNVLLEQHYCVSDDIKHIRSLLPALHDRRYIRVNGRALLLVYRTELLPDPKATSEIWREEALKAGIGELFLVTVESFGSGIAPKTIGFDAAVEFAPDWRNVGNEKLSGFFDRIKLLLGLKSGSCLGHRLYEYRSLVLAMINKKTPDYPFYRCVCPSFDNSPRRKIDSVVFMNSTPELFLDWLQHTVNWTVDNHEIGDRLLFINAWNEWGEGNHLEPDFRWGRAYLEKCNQAIICTP